MKKGSSQNGADGTLLTQCIYLTESARNHVDMYARIRQRGKAGTCTYWSDICIYICLGIPRFSLSLSPESWEKTSRRPRAAVQCPPFGRHTRSRLTLLRLPCDCSALASSAPGSVYPSIGHAICLLSRSNGTKRGVALFIKRRIPRHVFRGSIFVLSFPY